MTMPIKPDWNIFKAKFANPQADFEWFCYLLFCKENSRPTGISRYKQQSAIENDPIDVDGRLVGWQAKFYDSSLSKHSREIKDTISCAKRDYPQMSKLVFFTNQEWGQNRGKEPKSKKETEEFAKTAGIELVVRTASYFESPFVTVDNAAIAIHFFSLDKSPVDMARELRVHTENVLGQIQASVSFGDEEIEIDRSGYLEEVEKCSGQVVILSGVGGVGKTALIKRMYENLHESTPFYVFKATEFELRNIDDLFGGHGEKSFMDLHDEDPTKIVVIDSAERLLDLKNDQPIKAFLSDLIRFGWKIIFTTRDNYLEELNCQFFEVYHLTPLNISIRNLSAAELAAVSASHGFSLPKDGALLELIRNPFYLKEYLGLYGREADIRYVDFKEKIWNRIIMKSKPAREQCLLRLALERANGGHFFVKPDCDQSILDDELKKDGILGYESPHGYFITHDIYEEWALEKTIEAEFARKASNADFFLAVGSSLPMRRSYRKWLSEKLMLKDAGTRKNVGQILEDEAVPSFWKDETLISVLLSDYSDEFFDQSKELLLVDGQRLLKKMAFLLRLACKEVDDTLLFRLGRMEVDMLTLNYVLTKPRGAGWGSLIKFVFDNLDSIGIENTHYVLSVVYDWNCNHHEGVTTRYASLIALKFYIWTIAEDVTFSSRDDFESHLLQTILRGSSEIVDELRPIVANVVRNGWKRHRDPYHDLSEMILTTFDGAAAARVMPDEVLRLADCFWSFTPVDDPFFTRSSVGVEEYFGMEDDYHNYYPVSSYQTPIYWLLQASLQKTVDFILEFTNKSVDYFAKSDFAMYEIEEVEMSFDDGISTKQYASDRLWRTYRGTHVSPHVLVSMHMALEKYLLEIGKVADSKVLENWLHYILKRSRSASLTAVVASIVLAYPDKSFNVAATLFRTKEYFSFDIIRYVADLGWKDNLLALKQSFGVNSKNEIHETERIDACDADHRKDSLENLFLKYQFFRSEGTSENEVERRQRVLWGILDKYYERIPADDAQTDADRKWRLCLARMDRRKMRPTTENADGGVRVDFNPEIDPELKDYSEKSLKSSSAPMKYLPLKMWARLKMAGDEKYKQYADYDGNPKLVLKEVKSINSKLKAVKKRGARPEDKGFLLVSSAVPAEACSVLFRDKFDELSIADRAYCKRIVLSAAASCLRGDYQYSVSDGVQSALSVLPVMLDRFPQDRGRIKTILLLALFNDHTVDMAGNGFRVFPILALRALWQNHFVDAQSVLTGYIVLKPKYVELREKMRRERYSRGQYESGESDDMSMFIGMHERCLQRIADNGISIAEVGDIEQLDLSILRTAFQIIPLTPGNEDHKLIVRKIISAFAGKLMLTGRDEKVDYKIAHDFLERFAYFLLNVPTTEVKGYLEPFLGNFNPSRNVADMLVELISAEDRQGARENFWEVWNLLKEKIVEACKDGSHRWYLDEIVESYLFARNQWKESAVGWGAFRDVDKSFFEDVSDTIGHHPSTLYAIAKLLNGIGSMYLEDGAYWIFNILKNNQALGTIELRGDTVYYLESVARKLVYKNRERMRKDGELRRAVLTILEFIIDKGSVVGYLLRENIL
jgi:hypothetical protein